MYDTVKQNGVKGGCKDAGQLFDDDYIEMDPLYVEPPLESGEDSDEPDGGTLKANNSEWSGREVAKNDYGIWEE